MGSNSNGRSVSDTNASVKCPEMTLGESYRFQLFARRRPEGVRKASERVRAFCLESPGNLRTKDPGAVDGGYDPLYGWQPVAQSASG
jgi:hypothetical protein